ncbi:hypothetical protein RBU60_12590 [Mesonia sp. MT50]|uniref:DUF4231 domain-containing protein n=1 Tax=Mesonia profundi TaxID=3070998 RepID=A0ABU1A3X0_9FLAO|nr:hypothetical protein [Mesonia profundi]MDQ7918410.1 hypothetical protein [Mesonia profundi]
MGKTEEEIEQWKEYRLSILEQKGKSDDDFEKYITFIASGGLALTLTFINEISPLKESIYVWTIVVGWFFLAATLFLNLLSHFLSSQYNEKTIQNIDEEIDYETLLKNIEIRNKVISNLNLTSIILLGLGIIMILTFTTINAYNNG